MSGGRRRLAGMLATCCGVAGVLLAWALWPEPAPIALAPQEAPDRPVGYADPTASLPRLEDMTVTVERPLFLATRRVAPMEATIPAEDLIFGRYRFGGVVIAPGQRVLLLRPAEGGPIRRAKEGEVIEGLRIERIAKDRVVVSGRNGRQEIPIGAKAARTRQ